MGVVVFGRTLLLHRRSGFHFPALLTLARSTLPPRLPSAAFASTARRGRSTDCHFARLLLGKGANGHPLILCFPPFATQSSAMTCDLHLLSCWYGFSGWLGAGN